MTPNPTRTDELMSIIEEYGSLCHEAGTHRFHDGHTHCARALLAIRLAVESMADDAATLAWIRAEHDRFDPLVKCVIKAGRGRHGGQWAEFIDGANFAAIVDLYARTDAEIAARKAAKTAPTAQPEATVPPPLPPV